MTIDTRHAFELSNPPGLYDPSSNGDCHIAAPGARLLFIAGQDGEDLNGRLPIAFPEQALASLDTAVQS